MSEDTVDPLSVRIKGETIGANIERALEAGILRRREDGRLELVMREEGKIPLTPYIGHGSERFGQPCRFLNSFLFQICYGEGAVPFGCRTCFKLKVVSRTLRQLMAVREIAETYPYSTKSGPEVDNPDNPHPYGTYFYFHSLEEARVLYRELRPKFDADPRIGPQVEILIKRGCTNYEAKSGPSDQWRFDPEFEPLEAALSDMFVMPEQPARTKMLNAMRMMDMVATAYRIGDDTYRDFTDGRRLGPAVLRYPLDET